jgi:glycosyltransferase involved in cell wall biosynthesis
MKRIGINAVYLDPHRTGGVETYVRQFLAVLQNLQMNAEVLVFAGRDHGLTLNGRIQIVECDVDPRRQYQRVLWEQLHLPAILNSFHLDLVHFPYSACCVDYAGRYVVSLNDSIRFLHPETVPSAYRWYRRTMEQRLVGSGQHVIAVSHADAANLRRFLRLSAEQISVVPYSLPDGFALDGPAEKGDFILWVGRPYPHKNLHVLLQAYRLLRSRRSDAPRLRLIGIEDSHRRGVEAMCDAAGVSHGVSLEPPLPHDQLPAVFRSALLLAFPSRYESFGLPVLEAMASGTAVVCSSIPAFRELFAPAALLADGDSPGAFADAMETVLGDQSIRRSMEERGRCHAKRFTPVACAEATVAVYEKLLTLS